MFALIFKSKVIQIEAVFFDVHPDLIWIDITLEEPFPEIGWNWDGNVFTVPPTSKAPPTDDEIIDSDILKSPTIRGLIRAVASRTGVSETDIINQIKTLK